MHGWGGWSGFWWMVVVWGSILVVVWALIRTATRSPRSSEPSRPTPVEILEERYARGEIDTQEYAERRRELLGAAS